MPLMITAIFAISRIAFYLDGVRMDISVLIGHGNFLQLLDFNQLQHNLIQSIWYLQSQPPLFNFTTGLLLRLPTGMLLPTVVLISLALGLGMAFSFYYLCLELRIPTLPSLLLTVVVILDPANVLYGNWYFYSFPTAALLTFAALSLARFSRTRSIVWGSCYFTSLMAIVMLNSTFQWLWLVPAALPVAIVNRRHWRRVLTVAAIPLVIVFGWYAKNAILFQTYATSSWLGMNMARITVSRAPSHQIAKLVSNGKISELVYVGTFMPLADYGPQFADHKPRGVAVLDQPLKSDGKPNLNDLSYIRISDQFLHDDLTYIRTYPGNYLVEIQKATNLFFIPSDQYGFFGANATHIASYVHWYDALVDWQPHQTTIATNALAELYPAPDEVSIQAMVTFAVTLLGVPFAVWRRRHERPFALTLSLIWMSTAYVFALSVLLDFSENQRFRYDLGPLPLAATAAVVAALFARRRTDEPDADPR